MVHWNTYLVEYGLLFVLMIFILPTGKHIPDTDNVSYLNEKYELKEFDSFFFFSHTSSSSLHSCSANGLTAENFALTYLLSHRTSTREFGNSSCSEIPVQTRAEVWRE